MPCLVYLCLQHVEFVPVVDSIIGSVMSKLQNSGKKYTAVYTAKESSQVRLSSIDVLGIER